MVNSGTSPHDYIAVSVALSYIEGVQQYREGKSTPRKQAGAWFKKSAMRIFSIASEEAINRLWEEVRCGLFHCGFTDGKTYLSHSHEKPLEIVHERLNINPRKFVEGVFKDFQSYVEELYASKSDENIGKKFLDLWDTRWENS